MDTDHPATSRRERQAHRILDAAAGLSVRHGFDKTTLEDVASAAGVSKSTLYLRWNTREALLTAVLRRERLAVLAQVRDRMADADEPATPGKLFSALALALRRSALLHLTTGTSGSVVLHGLFTEKKRARAAEDPLRSGAVPYLTDLHSAELVRSDLEPRELGTVLYSVVAGFLFTAPPGPAEDGQLTDDRRAELLGDTVDRCLSSGRAHTCDEAARTAHITRHHLDRFIEIARAKLNDSLAGGSATVPDTFRAHE